MVILLKQQWNLANIFLMIVVIMGMSVAFRMVRKFHFQLFKNTNNRISRMFIIYSFLHHTVYDRINWKLNKDSILTFSFDQKKVLDLSRMIKEGSLVLVLGENKLWSSARVAAMDGEKLAVRLLLTGKEIAVDQSKIYPIPQLANDAEGFF